MRHKNLVPTSISLLLSLYVSYKIYSNEYSHSLIFIWLLSILLIMIAFGVLNIIKKIHFSKRWIFLMVVLSLPIIVRVSNYNLNRIHGDDLITAYFSAQYDFDKINFFSVIPQERGDWVCQFPTVFFVIQKIFFTFFGENLLTIKLSVTPYIFIVSLMIFLIVKKILNEKTALISIIIYSFFAPSLYLETLGLHFISSTVMFLIFFYFLILSIKAEKIIYPLLTGIFGAFCYLFYTSSYIALPILAFSYFIQFITKRRFTISKYFLISILSFLITISPFITYAYKYDGYFSQRINQVSLLNGEWSGAKDRIKNGEHPLTIIKENLILSFKSLYTDGIGGHGGYSFGNFAFFDRFTLALFIIGTLSGLLLLFKYKKTEIALLYSIVIISFFTAIVLTIPPPAYHRFSIVFPFLVIIISFPFFIILSLRRINNLFKYSVILSVVLIYIMINQSYFLSSVMSEEYHEQLALSDFINQRFDKRNIYVAAFPAYAFEKIYYFTENKKAISIQSDYHINLIRRFNPNEKYLYIILFPDNFDDKFLQLDKKGELVKFSKTHSLFFN